MRPFVSQQLAYYRLLALLDFYHCLDPPSLADLMVDSQCYIWFYPVDIGQGKGVPLPCLPDMLMLCLLGALNYLPVLPNFYLDDISLSETQPCTLHDDYLVQNISGGQL